MAKSRQMLSVRAQVGLVVANIAVILGVLGAAVAAPTSPFVAVVVAPWSDAETAVKVVAAAQGSLIAPGRFGWIVIAHSPDGAFASRLRQAGAWFVLDHKTLSGCFQR
jgi:hypothetical protein